MAGRKAWSLHDTNRDTILCLTRGLARYALWCQEVSVASWCIMSPRVSIWNDERDQAFIVFSEAAFNNFSPWGMAVDFIRPKATCGHWGASSMLLGSFKPPQIASEIVQLDIGFQVKEMVALRPPFRAEDMEGLYRILNTIRLRIFLDSTRLFPTLQYEDISAGHWFSVLNFLWTGKVVRGQYPRIPAHYSSWAALESDYV